MALHNRVLIVFVVFAALGLSACAKQYTPGQLGPDVQTGTLYYTQFSLFQEKGRYRTTNYRRGFLIPINTPVTLVSIDSKRIEVKVNDGGETLIVENVPKHTNEDVPTAFRKLFGKRKVNLGQFTAAEQKLILGGKVDKGMSREAVLAAIGYPPAHMTPDLKGDDWTYWSNRYDRFIVRFKGNRVAEIVN